MSDPPPKRYRVEAISQPARYDVPAALARQIGRFIVVWAYFEHVVQDIIWKVLEVTPAEGRIAVREPRVTDRLDIIRDLGELKGRTADYVLLHSIRKRADALLPYRNLMAHSFWTKVGNDWVAQSTRGVWQDPSKGALEDAPKGSKSVTPESIPVSVDTVRGWIERTEELIRDLRRLPDNHTVVQKPSQHKSKTRSERRKRNPDQID